MYHFSDKATAAKKENYDVLTDISNSRNREKKSRSVFKIKSEREKKNENTDPSLSQEKPSKKEDDDKRKDIKKGKPTVQFSTTDEKGKIFFYVINPL